MTEEFKAPIVAALVEHKLEVVAILEAADDGAGAQQWTPGCGPRQ